MEWFPALRLGWLNGWLFLPFIYLLTEGLARSLPKDVSPRLFDREAWTRRDEILSLVSGVPTWVHSVLLILTPLRTGSWLLPMGSAAVALGTAACAHSILMFARTAPGEPVTRGLYRISRNPQIAGMFIAFVGASLAIGSWVALGVVVVWGALLHARVLAEERTCLARYGDTYRQFMERVPRYLIF